MGLDMAEDFRHHIIELYLIEDVWHHIMVIEDDGPTSWGWM